MTLRRIAVLARALAIAAILAPGPWPGGPALPGVAAQSEAQSPTDATGIPKGVGCLAGTQRFEGPRLPGDPPPPPGYATTPTPSPTPLESIAPAGSASPAGSAPAAHESTGVLLLAARVTTPTADAVLDQEAPSTSPAPAVSPGPDATAEPPVAPGSEQTPAPRARKSKLIKGIDVSHHNGDVDFANVLKAKQRFVFVKATQDTSFVDQDFASNVARARAAGVLVGAYHFFDYSLDGTAQADHFVDRLEAAGGILDALPPVVDVECWQPSGPSTHVVTEARLRDFVARVYERTGRLPIVYTSSFMWSEVTGDSDAFGHLPLWAACWGCEAPPTLAAPWDEWLFWQTGIGRIKGVGRLDANVFSGSDEDLVALVLRPLAIEGGAIATRSANVTVDLGGRHATDYRTSPDGDAWSPWRPLRATARAQLGPEEGSQTLFFQLRAAEGLRSPVYSDAIILDRTDPELSAVTVGLADGPIATEPPPSTPTSTEPSFAAPTGPQVRVPVRVAWTAADALSGLADASVDVACGEGPRTRVEVPGSAAPGEESAWQAVVGLDPVAVCEVSVVVRDAAGNSTRQRLTGIEAAGLSPAG